MSVTTDANSNPVPNSPVRGRGRWKIGAGLLILAIIAQGGLWAYYSGDRTSSKLSILFVWPAALFCLAIWWTFFSAQPWRTRLGVWGLIILGFLGFNSVFVFDNVDGEMTPIFRYRWQRSAKEHAQDYLTNKPAPEPVASNLGEDALEPLTATEGDWTGFRGPQRDGIVINETLRNDWRERPLKEVWRHPVGLGWSSFAIVGDFAFTQEQRGPNECVVCYRVQDGQEVWVHADHSVLEIVEINGGNGPHGTPEFYEGRLYSLGGMGLLNCLDARTGRPIWQADILKDGGTPGEPTQNIQWGMSGSPLVVDDLVITNPGSKHGRATIAYDRLTGKIVWTAGTYEAGYASPHLATIHGVRQVVIFHGTGIAGHDLADGRELWNFEWANSPKVNSAQPIIYDDGSVLFGCSYSKGTARIDLAPNSEAPWSAKLRWKTNKFRPKFNDFVRKDGLIYGLDDGILTCLDPETGKIRWKDRAGQFGYGQLLLFNDVLLILSEEGELVQVAAVPDGYREITRVEVLDRICWNNLAVAHGKLLVRNNHTAVCFDLNE